MRHFYLFLTKQGLVPNNLLAALKPWDTPHKKAYGTFSTQEKEKILGAIDRNSPAGKRDYAIFSLAIDCGIRSSDICSLSRVDKRLTPQAPHRTVRAPFTHTAPHNNIRF